MKKRYFSLLEVLISILLLLMSLPLLLTPFVLASTDQMETIQKLKDEKIAFYILTSLLIDLQTGGISLSQLDSDQPYPLKSDWKALPASGSYSFKKLKPQRQTNTGIELWQVTIQLNENSTFLFQFIVQRNKTPEAPDFESEASDDEI